AADDLGGEGEAGARLVWLDAELDAGELARTARLLLVRVVVLNQTRDRLAIGNLRRADIGLDLELALHAIDENVEVKLAHARDDGLAGFLVGLDAERRVFGGEASEREAHLLLVGLGLRLDGDVDDRLRELHALKNDLVGRIRERITRGRVL